MITMNKQPLNREQCKDIQVDILNYIDETCEKINAEYSLAYGTLLGAVRHQGFIPWDDDIDVLLMRDDYDKLVLRLKQNNDAKYKVIDFDIEHNYYYPFVKVVDTETIAKMENNTTEHGIWVDVFPIDNLPNDSFKRWFYLKKCFLYRSIIIAMTTDFSASNLGKKKIAKQILNIIANVVGKQNVIKQYVTLIKTYANKDAEYVGCLSSPYIGKEVLEKTKLTAMTKMLFEGKEYSAIKEWDYYLKTLYGDYMTLPPVDKRRVHSITAWKIENE